MLLTPMDPLRKSWLGCNRKDFGRSLVRDTIQNIAPQSGQSPYLPNWEGEWRKMSVSGVLAYICLNITWRAAGSFRLMEHPQAQLTACKAIYAGLYSSWVMMTLAWTKLSSGWRVRSREMDWHPRVQGTLNQESLFQRG